MNDAVDTNVFSFFAGLPQQGPGRDVDTLAALRVIAERLPDTPAVADMGCGTGRSTLALARSLQSTITAIELSPVLCAGLRERAAAAGLAQLIDVREADMSQPPLAERSQDLIWSEASAYSIGFAEALTAWRRLLKDNAFCVASECAWLSEERPQHVAAFWNREYPAMRTLEGNASLAEDAGYIVEATHVLPEAGWHAYYGPIKEAMARADTKILGADFE
ncbi:MAG: class I SAM-dependent methyltransferase, partial [Rhodospirillaceae bacterium]